MEGRTGQGVFQRGEMRMCVNCWIERGSPQINNDKVKSLVEVIGRVYDISCVGGLLHIVLDEWNLEDENVKWCLEDAIPENFHQHSEEEIAIEIECALALLSATEEERGSALARFEGFTNEEGDNV
jgi:hypothetical protein